MNRSFIDVGKRLLPKATWIEGDIFEETKAFSDKHFSTIMSNPPFGRFSKIRPLDKNNFGEFEYEAIHLGKRIADIGIFIIPQMSAPTHPGHYGSHQPEPRKYNKFFEKSGIALEIEGSVDCEGYRNDWKGTVINVELVNTVYE